MDKLIKELERWIAKESCLKGAEESLWKQGYNQGQASAREHVKLIIDLYGKSQE